MATCENVTLIFDSECVGESLGKINTNFFNLDSGLCQLGADVIALEAFIKSLSAKDSATIDMTFSAPEYSISANVLNNSLGTIKLGQDIPQTTKVFLTAAKVSSLIDTNIIDPQTGQLLLWNGSSWTNQFLPDQSGAKELSGLFDISFSLPLQNGQILKFNEFTNTWYNGPDETELTVRNGDYGDIRVQTGPVGLGPQGRGGPGTLWDIKPGAVTEPKLANDSVTTNKIVNLAITNDKIANNTIGLEKCNFGVGEINTGENIGEGAGVFAQKQGVNLQFKSLVASGAVTLTPSDNTITIRVPTAAEPVGATGENLGTGASVYSTQQSSSGNLKFKRIRAGSGISIFESDNEIRISVGPQSLGLSIIGTDSSGNPLSQSQIASIVNQIYPASSFPVTDNNERSTCRVEAIVPAIEISSNYDVTVPVTIKYQWNGNKNNVGNFFKLIQPIGVQTGVNVQGGIDEYTGTETYTGTATAVGGPSKLKVTSRTIYSFLSNGSSWEPF